MIMDNCQRALFLAIAAVNLWMTLSVASLPAFAQGTNQQQQIPDAPSATRPFPKPSVSPTEPAAAPDTTPNENGDQVPPPSPNITTVPPGGATPGSENGP